MGVGAPYLTEISAFYIRWKAKKAFFFPFLCGIKILGVLNECRYAHVLLRVFILTLLE